MSSFSGWTYSVVAVVPSYPADSVRVVVARNCTGVLVAGSRYKVLVVLPIVATTIEGVVP